MLVLLKGDLSFENYSQTLIKLTANDQGYVTELFFDKKTTTIYVSESNMEGEYIYINSIGSDYQFYFIFGQIVLPVCTYMDEFMNIVNGWCYGGIVVSLNGGTPLDPLGILNFIEGTNITITESYNSLTNSIDVTIDASGGGGGLPPDGTYGDVVVSGSGTVWTVTDDTSNQQVAVYEDGFIRGTRPSLNFYDDGGLVNITVADNPGNNRVDIGISSAGIGSTGYEMNFLLMGG